MSRALALFCLLFLAGCASTIAEAPQMPKTGERAEIGQQVAPPYGYIGYCLRERAECGRGTDTLSSVALTSELYAELERVNKDVNTLPQVEDSVRYGVPEYWTVADSEGGDCEDLAMLKREKLIALGWPRDALLITVVREWNGEGHAILTVETSSGELYLDTLTDAITTLDNLPYTLEKRQSRYREYVWVDLDKETITNVDNEPLLPVGAPIPFVAAIGRMK